jgi:hypothetical protein
MKKKFVAALTSAMLSASVMAMPNWVQVANSPNSTWYADSHSLKMVSPGRVTVWTKLVLSHPNPELPRLSSQIQHLSFTCGAPSLTIDSNVSYSESGEVLHSSDYPSAAAVPPGSVFEGVMEASCQALGIK